MSEAESLVLPARTFSVERITASTMASAHWHDHVELNMMLDGDMTYLFNGRQEHVEAGRLALFWAAIPHQTIIVTPGASLICIYLPLVDFLALPIPDTSRQALMQGAFVAEAVHRPATPLVAEQWNSEWGTCEEKRRQIVCDEVKLAVRRLFLDDANGSSRVIGNRRPLSPALRHAQRLTEIINLHFTEPLTLGTISGMAGLHSTTANRAFRDVLGISTMEYLTRYRLSRAMQQLTGTEDALIKIVMDCGFGSTARFYQAFKERVGTTPRQFRQMTRRQSSEPMT